VDELSRELCKLSTSQKLDEGGEVRLQNWNGSKDYAVGKVGDGGGGSCEPGVWRVCVCVRERKYFCLCTCVGVICSYSSTLCIHMGFVSVSVCAYVHVNMRMCVSVYLRIYRSICIYIYV